MTDYWVSTAKHFCKFCNVWIHDNKVSIKHHEGGARHKQNVETFFKEKRDKKLQGAISENELDKQLREIERAALAQAEQDAALFGGSAAAAARPPPPPPRTLVPPGARPPPPPPRRDHGDSGYRQDEDEEAAKAAAEKAAAEAEKEEKEMEGRYTVDGVTYLDCKVHGAKLAKGVPCEIWVEAEDRWIEGATVLSVTVTAVPNTDIILRKCAIKYKLDPEAAEASAITEEEVTPDRLRLVVEEEAKAPEPPPVDETTGLGGWHTVAVRVVDEAAEKAAAEAAVREEAERRRKEDELRRLRMMEDALEGEDAMSSYDPHGRGVYKGVKLKDSGAIAEAAAVEVDLGGDKDGPVAFKKKRKAAGAGGNRRKKTRDDDDEDD